MPLAKILLADDDAVVRYTLTSILEEQGFEINSVSSVSEALESISMHDYDVLLSDLRMPGGGDGLTVVSAMRHANPRAVTLLLNAFPSLDAAADAMILHTDEVLVKPVDAGSLVEVINQRLFGAPKSPRVVESVATILERDAGQLTQEWFELVEQDDAIRARPLNFKLRTAHLPHLLRDINRRLLSFLPLGGKSLRSDAAARHGKTRCSQGYNASMIVEESRQLQVSIFRTLQNNLLSIDCSLLLVSVMTIADEVDSQLGQTMVSFLNAQTTVRPAKTRSK